MTMTRATDFQITNVCYEKKKKLYSNTLIGKRERPWVRKSFFFIQVKGTRTTRTRTRTSVSVEAPRTYKNTRRKISPAVTQVTQLYGWNDVINEMRL